MKYKYKCPRCKHYYVTQFELEKKDVDFSMCDSCDKYINDLIDMRAEEKLIHEGRRGFYEYDKYH